LFVFYYHETGCDGTIRCLKYLDVECEFFPSFLCSEFALSILATALFDLSLVHSSLLIFEYFESSLVQNCNRNRLLLPLPSVHICLQLLNICINQVIIVDFDCSCSYRWTAFSLTQLAHSNTFDILSRLHQHILLYTVTYGNKLQFLCKLLLVYFAYEIYRSFTVYVVSSR